MTSLKALQESFQRGVLAGDDTILGEIKGSAKESRDVLFGVYRNAYVLRLIEVLTEDYEQLHAYLGDVAFAKLTRAYIDAHPPTGGARGISGAICLGPCATPTLTPSTPSLPRSPSWRRRSVMPLTGQTPSL
jgi:Putative DNA-binding domain